MNYKQYKQMTETTEINQDLYRSMLKDAASGDSDRLNAILHIFEILNVPADYQGDIQTILAEGMEEIAENEYSKDIATMIWALSPDVSNSVYNTLEQIDLL
jgi:hypothetical protein